MKMTRTLLPARATGNGMVGIPRPDSPLNSWAREYSVILSVSHADIRYVTGFSISSRREAHYAKGHNAGLADLIEGIRAPTTSL